MNGVNYLYCLLCIAFMANCKEIAQSQAEKDIDLKTTLKRENFESNSNGHDARFYVLQNNNGLEATFSNYGQRLLSLMVPDREGKFMDIVLGFENLQRYREARERYFGAFVGRYANRISEGRFSIAGKKYTLATNNGTNHLHGGILALVIYFGKVGSWQTTSWNSRGPHRIWTRGIRGI